MASHTFNKPRVAKAIQTVKGLGLTVSGIELAPDNTIRVLTTPETQSQADAELDRWLKTQDG